MKYENALKLKALYLMSFNVKETFFQLKQGGVNILMSWGARNFTNFENKGFLFRVSGFKHKGYVFITLDVSDTYTVHLMNLKCDVIKTIKNVYCDELTEKIDNIVEKTENYEDKIKKHYKL